MKIIDFVKTGSVFGIGCGRGFNEAKSVIGAPLRVSLSRHPEIHSYGVVQIYVQEDVIYGISLVISKHRQRESVLDIEDCDDFLEVPLERFVKLLKRSSVGSKALNKFNQMVLDNNVTAQFQDGVLIGLTIRDRSVLPASA